MKRIVLLALIVIMVFGLAACDNGDNSAGTTDSRHGTFDRPSHGAEPDKALPDSTASEPISARHGTVDTSHR